MNISVILPAYQEEGNLTFLLPQINDVLNGIDAETEVLVIDTMQIMDKTPDICLQYGAKYIQRRGGNSYGDAIRTGISEAAYQYIVIMDCDGSHDPQEIPAFFSICKSGADIVIGSRYIKDGNTDNNIILKTMSRMVNIAYRLIFGLRVSDVSDSFRMYKASMLKSIPLECNNFDIVEEILIKLVLQYKNIHISEQPILFKKRIYGESKRNLLKFAFSYLTTIVKLLKIKMKYKRKETFADHKIES